MGSPFASFSFVLIFFPFVLYLLWWKRKLIISLFINKSSYLQRSCMKTLISFKSIASLRFFLDMLLLDNSFSPRPFHSGKLLITAASISYLPPSEREWHRLSITKSLLLSGKLNIFFCSTSTFEAQLQDTVSSAFKIFFWYFFKK